MGHLGLATLGAYTAPGFLAAAKTLLVGDTSHGWTFVAEAGSGGDAGVDVAIYGYKAVTGGILVVALCGNVAGGTPGGALGGDVAAGNKLWGGVGFISTGSSLVWTTWTAANPMTNGSWGGWSPICIPTSNAVANKVQVWTYDGGLVLRPESTTTATCRVTLIGDLVLPYTDAGQRLVTAPTTQAHGACIGMWTINSTSPLDNTWLTALHSTVTFGMNNTLAAQPKGWYVDGTTRRPCRLHFPLKTITATTCRAAGKDGGCVVTVTRDDAAPDDTIIGIHPHIIGGILLAGGEVQVGGIPVEIIVSRNSGSAEQALLMSVARRSRAL